MIGRRQLGKARRWLDRRVVAPIAVGVETLRALRTRARITSFQHRGEVVRRFAEPPAENSRSRVLAVVTHVVDGSRPTELSAERLGRTLDGLLESLGHTQLELVLNTLPGRHVAEALPEHLSSRLVVRERDGVDPMLLGFEAQTEFVDRAEDFDWFIYFEDDLVLSDSLVLEKLAYFNSGAPPDALLLPHRYEFWNGQKTYIDLESRHGREWAWNRLTLIQIESWRFAEFENPHSGCYFLSRQQLGRWTDTGRQWFGQVSYTAQRESAATGCLGEAFRLYKPHPANLTFLELRHWDTKYAQYFARSLEAAGDD